MKTRRQTLPAAILCLVALNVVPNADAQPAAEAPAATTAGNTTAAAPQAGASQQPAGQRRGNRGPTGPLVRADMTGWPETAKVVLPGPTPAAVPFPVPEDQLTPPPASVPAILNVAQNAKTPNQPPRMMEKLGRGVVALNQGEGKVWVSWRLLGTEPANLGFNVYRSTDGGAPVKLNAQPITNVTFYQDTGVDTTKSNEYFVHPVLNGQEGESSKRFLSFLPANAPVREYIEIPIKTPQGFGITDASVGDLDGDGEYELVVHLESGGHDSAQTGFTGEPVFQAYKMDGTMLWQINLGKNIREGAHYSPFLVYDFDGDGRAEMICRTAPGTVDGTNNWVLLPGDDPTADYRNANGHVAAGPEYLTVFDGLTGKALATTHYVPARAPDLNPTSQEMASLWGDGNYNRSERYNATVAYLDGVHPSAVMQRGYYTWTNLVAWDWRDGKLTQRWYFNGNDVSPRGGTREERAVTPTYNGQGNHQINLADCDGDGKDDIVIGAMAVRSDGKPLWTTNLGHGDAMHLSDLDPDSPGLEVYSIQERYDDAGMHMISLPTGRVLWKVPSLPPATTGSDAGEGPGRGVAADIDPRYPGYESWATGAGGSLGLYDDKGRRISNRQPSSCNFAIFWDGDTLCELLDSNHIDKWNWETERTERILTADGCSSNNGTKSTPCISADLFGDWREEVAWRTTDNQAIRIYSSTIPTEWRTYTLMHDPTYRMAVSWQNSSYNQPPHPGFYFGANMPAPPRPNIVLVEPKPAK